jgi:hypothetical protein
MFTMSGVVFVSVPQVALISTVLLPVSCSGVVVFEVFEQPLKPWTTSTVSSIGTMMPDTLPRRTPNTNSNGNTAASVPNPVKPARAAAEVVLPVIVKLVVVVPPSVIEAVAGVKAQVIPTGSPVQAYVTVPLIPEMAWTCRETGDEVEP